MAAKRIIREIGQMLDFEGTPADGQSMVYNGTTGKWNPRDMRFVHTQNVASATWTITHNLKAFPNVTIVDSGNTEVIGEQEYPDENTVILRFRSPFSGKAYLT